MAYVFRFPDVGEGISEGRVVKWLLKQGDAVKEDQPLGEIETDKAVVEMPSPRSGIVLRLHVAEGGIVKVGGPLATIGEAGEKAEVEQAPSPTQQQTPAPLSFTHPLATPAIRRLARELNIDLAKISGAGPAGRITEQDVRTAAGQAGAPPAKAPATAPSFLARPAPPKIRIDGPVERVPLSDMRKLIAQRLVQSFYTAPHVSHFDEADVTDLWTLREKSKGPAQEKGVHLTFLPFIAKAVTDALKENPLFNSSLDEEKGELILKKYYNLGIAVDTPEGLSVIVVKDADKKSVLELGREINALAEQARSRKIRLEDLHGSTFTITNYGSVRGLFATPIINPGEAAILGIGKIRDAPVAKEGALTIRKLLPLSFTFDHRIADGAEAARFAESVIKRLEIPASFL